MNQLLRLRALAHLQHGLQDGDLAALGCQVEGGGASRKLQAALHVQVHSPHHHARPRTQQDVDACQVAQRCRDVKRRQAILRSAVQIPVCMQQLSACSVPLQYGITLCSLDQLSIWPRADFVSLLGCCYGIQGSMGRTLYSAPTHAAWYSLITHCAQHPDRQWYLQGLQCNQPEEQSNATCQAIISCMPFIPALAAHVVNTHIPQRHDAVVSMDLGIVADQEPEDVRLGPQHRVMDRAAPLRLVHSKGVCALLQEVRCAGRLPACAAPNEAPRSLLQEGLQQHQHDNAVPARCKCVDATVKDNVPSRIQR